jgi:starch synthase
MLVTYVAPNRAHHYTYAAALARSGHLQRFVCGFSRFSPRAPLPDVADKLLRVDHVQNFYLASMRLGMPSFISEELIFLSKLWLDRCATRDALLSDAFLFYSGTGLRTLRALKATRTVGIVEAVNSHVLTQKEILQEEHDRLSIPLKGFHERDVARRVEEINMADGIICPSTFTQQSFIERGIPADRVRLVPFGIHPPPRLEPSDRPDDVFRVLFVGQINIRKGLRYLFEAFEKFKHPRKELWVVGPKADPTGIEDMTPPEQTKFLGVLKGESLSRAYLDCHVLVLPTLEEGMALVMGEALSHGLPVIATVNSGGTDLLSEGANGFVVAIRSPDAIAEKLQLLADSPELLKNLSNQTGTRDMGIRSWENTVQILVETLEDFTRMSKL